MADAYYEEDQLEVQQPFELELVSQLKQWAGIPNLASELKQEQLDQLGETVYTEYKIDLDSRSDWEETAKRASEAIDSKIEQKTYPFNGAANIKYPLLTTATLQFAARAFPAIVQTPKIVKCAVQGKDPSGIKKARSERVSSFMSYQLIKKMPEWVEDTDTLLHQLPVVGCSFRKTYWSFERDRPCSEMVSAFDFVVNNSTRDLENCPRATHVIPPLYPHEIKERVNAGTFLDIDHEEPEDAGEDSQAAHRFLEQHRRLDLDGDGYPEPYIVTIHEMTHKVVRIVANYKPDDIIADEQRIIRIPANSYFTKIPFIPDPNGGYYDIGYGKLLDSLSETINSSLNKIMDAGHLQNAGGGFIGSGLRMKSSMLRQEPGKYHTVNSPGSAIRDAIVHIQHPGPSSVLFQLLGMMIDAGKEVASVSEVITGDVQRNQTATTTLALIEQGLKVFTAIYKRIFRSLSREFELLYQLNHDYLDDDAYQKFIDMKEELQGGASVTEDFNDADMDICPVADPNEVTDMQRLGRGQLLLEISQDPLMDRKKALQRFLEAAGFTDIDELFVEQQGPSPMEEMQLKSMEVDMDKTTSEAERNRAMAQKAEADTLKAGLDVVTQGGEAMANAMEQGQIDADH